MPCHGAIGSVLVKESCDSSRASGSCRAAGPCAYCRGVSCECHGDGKKCKERTLHPGASCRDHEDLQQEVTISNSTPAVETCANRLQSTNGDSPRSPSSIPSPERIHKRLRGESPLVVWLTDLPKASATANTHHRQCGTIARKHREMKAVHAADRNPSPLRARFQTPN